jgi:N-acetylneuraminate lyase
MAEAFAKALDGPQTLIVHVGHNCLKEASELAQHAASIGADAVAASPPSYFRPASAEILVDCLAEIAEGAPHLPLYYYHIPEATGVAFEMREFLEKASNRVPNLAGIKFTEERIYDFQNCMEVAGGRFNMLYGRDEMLLSALAAGAKGAVGGTYNFTARLFLRMWAAFDLGDMEEARKWQARGARLVSVLKQYGQLCAWKTLMRWRGIELGGYRLPLKGLDADREIALKKDLEEIGYFAWGG